MAGLLRKFAKSPHDTEASQALPDEIPAYSNDPDLAWVKEKMVKKVQVVQPLDWKKTAKPEGHTRFVCMSDTHGRTDRISFEIPPGDVLLHSGDFTNVGLPSDVRKFADFFSSQPHPHKIVIAGNHDLTFDTASYPALAPRFHGSRIIEDCEAVKDILRKAPGVTYLEDSGTTVNGISIWGSPWQPEFCNWGFNLPRGLPCKEKWDLIPAETDVLITHGPPLGHGDLCQPGRNRAGCVQLLHAVQKIRPKYHVFGHVHEGYGVTTDKVTTFINASTCNLQYRPAQPPIVFDLPATR